MVSLVLVAGMFDVTLIVCVSPLWTEGLAAMTEQAGAGVASVVVVVGAAVVVAVVTAAVATGRVVVKAGATGALIRRTVVGVVALATAFRVVAGELATGGAAVTVVDVSVAASTVVADESCR